MIRRIKLIDPILTLGFLRISEYLMSIYLPNVPQHIQKEMEISIKLLRERELANRGSNLAFYDVKFMRNIVTLNKESKFSPKKVLNVQ